MVIILLGPNVFPGFPIQLGHLEKMLAELTEAGRFL
jgi:hypothetical protein